MLIKSNHKDKTQSIYCCDRCKVNLKVSEKIAIYTSSLSKPPKKRWDLCKRCYIALVRGIQKENSKVKENK